MQSKAQPNSEEKISLRKFFAYITPKQKAMLIFGTIGAVSGGLIYPIMAVALLLIVDNFDPSNDIEELMDTMRFITITIVCLGVYVWLTGYMFFAFWQHVAESISFDLRKRFLLKLLQQEVKFFETQQVESLPSLIGEYFSAIQMGIGEKLSNLINTLSMCIIGIAATIIIDPFLGLASFGFMPLIFLLLKFFSGAMVKNAIAKIGVSKKLGAIAEESIASIRVIQAFAREDQAAEKYAATARQQVSATVSNEVTTSAFVGLLRGLTTLFTPYVCWIGAIFIKNQIMNRRSGEPTSVGDIVGVQMCALVGVTILLSLNPNLAALTKVMVVGQKVFAIIDREPEIKDKEGALKHFELEKGIRFEEATFRYPAAQEGQDNILEKASFFIESKKNTAIIGPSGSGKSTIVQLIERLYDLQEGNIFFDEVSIRDLSLETLRDSIGYVSQEPVLIIGTVQDNLLLGNSQASEQDIYQAIRQANADFVYQMKDQLQTYIGSASIQNLSGGQKQRIAIARALIKKPKILILDEATSALDSKSEQEVLKAINLIREEEKQLTIVTIAHRIETIKTADNLIYLEKKDKQIFGSKGNLEYDHLIQRLEEKDYAHQIKKHAVLSISQPPDQFEIRKVQETVTSPREDRRLLTKNEFEEPDKEIDIASIEQRQGPELLQEKEVPQVPISEVFQYYRPLSLSLLGLLTTTWTGLFYPILAFLTAKELFVLFDHEADDFYKEVRNWNLWLIGMAVLFALTIPSNRYIFTYLGETLTFRVRTMLFESVLYKHLAWFDRKEAAPGIISNVLSEEIALLNGMTTEPVGVILEVVAALVVALAMGLYFSWRISLVSLAGVPFLIIGGYFSTSLIRKTKGFGNIGTSKAKDTKQIDYYGESNALLSDTIMNYKTVICFGPKNIDYLIQKYNNLLEVPRVRGIRSAHVAGLAFGYAYFVRYLYIAVVFFVAVKLIDAYDLDQEASYIAIMVLFYAALGSGAHISNLPSLSRAREAANKIFRIIKEENQIDSKSEEGLKEIREGEIEFKGAHFMYPSRPDPVFLNFNLRIPPKKKIALVGHSGCGKSTVVNLLLRFYDLESGELLIDGNNIKQFNIRAFRKQIGYVMQEPMLFNDSIKNNIAYGCEKASDEQVWQAAKNAYALKFIESNIEDIDTNKELQKIVREKFALKITELCGQHPEYWVFKEQVESEELTPKAAQLFLDLLSKADDHLTISIKNNPAALSKSLKIVSQREGSSWEEVLILFDFYLVEEPKIQQFLMGGGLHEEKDVKKWLEQQPGNFDLEMLEKFALTDHNQKTFSEVVFEEKARLEARQELLVKDFEKGQFKIQESFKLHEGFNKMCGLKGSLLSGGQKQRIAIARAIIKDPRILVLDEATSALDEKAQKIVQKALDKAMEGRTSLVIAHRLSTIKHCDWLCLIHEGKVVEQGTFQDLDANQDSYFFKLKSGMEM